MTLKIMANVHLPKPKLNYLVNKKNTSQFVTRTKSFSFFHEAVTSKYLLSVNPKALDPCFMFCQDNIKVTTSEGNQGRGGTNPSK